MSPRPVAACLVVVAACLTLSCSSSTDSTTSATTVTTSAAPTTPLAEPPPTTSVVPTTTAPTTPLPTTTTTTTTTTSSTSSTTANADGNEPTEAEMADRELARTALLTLDVFPDGWVEEPPDEEDDDDPGTEAFEAEFDRCLDREDAERVGDDLDELAVSTGDFHPADDDSTSVTHEVVLATDEAIAVTAMSEVSIDGAEPCLATVIQAFYIATFADDPDLTAIGVGEVIVTRNGNEFGPDAAVGVLLQIPLVIEDQTVSQYLEILYQRDGRALSKLFLSSFGSPFDRDGYRVLSEEVFVALATIGA